MAFCLERKERESWWRFVSKTVTAQRNTRSFDTRKVRARSVERKSFDFVHGFAFESVHCTRDDIGKDNERRREEMSQKIDPEAMQPTSQQSVAMSDRNPAVNEWGEGGGAIETPDASESRVTPEGPAVAADAGLKY